jgi:hypothetical protein
MDKRFITFEQYFRAWPHISSSIFYFKYSISLRARENNISYWLVLLVPLLVFLPGSLLSRSPMEFQQGRSDVMPLFNLRTSERLGSKWKTPDLPASPKMNWGRAL